MGEQLPQNVRGHRALDSSWFNKINRQVQANSFSVPSSVMQGFRGGLFQADATAPQTLLLRLHVKDYHYDPTRQLEDLALPENAEAGSFSLEEEPPRFFDQSGSNEPIRDHSVYLVEVLGLDPGYVFIEADGDEGAPTQYLAAKLTAQGEPKLAIANCTRGGFFIPERSNDLGGLGSQARIGDEFSGVFDYVLGRFAPIEPVSVRACKAVTDPNDDGEVNVQIYVPSSSTGDFVPTHTFVYGVRTGWLNVRPYIGDKAFIALIDGYWHAIAADQPDAIHFTLTEELTHDSASALATVTLFYNGDEPGGTRRVYNPPSGCQGTTYRHSGDVGCTGIAKRAAGTGRLWIWQIDCADMDDGDESSSSSVSGESSVSSSSSSSSTFSSSSSMSSTSS